MMSNLWGDEKGQTQVEGTKATVHGYALDEAVSALQKAIRAGDQERAGFFAYELAKTPKQSWRRWRRLKVIAAEDVGGMEPLIFVVAAEQAAKSVGGEDGVMIGMRAAIELARWVKRHGGDRTADDMKCVFDERFKEGWQGLPIKDVDLDCHTKRGRMMGRGDGFFWRESCKLVKESPEYDKQWLEEMRKRYEGRL